MSNQFLDFDLADFSNTNIKQLSLAEIRRDSYTEGFIKGKEEGRADVIDEVKNKVIAWNMQSDDGWIPCGQVIEWLEQLKEQTNE